MTAPITDFRAEIRQLIEDEFNPAPPSPPDPQNPPVDPFFAEIFDGKMHRLMGADGNNYASVYPVTQNPHSTDGLDQVSTVNIQIFTAFEAKRPVEPKKVASSAPIEKAVERLLVAIQGDIGNNTSGRRWFYHVTGVNYLVDPLGHVTRAEVTLEVHGNNPAIIETMP